MTPHALHKHRQSGVVLVITLLALTLLAALVFYVFNLGRGVQGRVETQHAADAAATAGGGWVARSLNTVAMNNVAMSRMLAAVNLLDAAPQATQYTLVDQEALALAIDRQLARGPGPYWVRDRLQEVLSLVEQEVAQLTDMDQLLNRSGYDIREATFYDGPSGRGDLWLAMESLDAFSQSTLQTMPLAAQLAAGAAVEANLGDAHAGGLMLPALPKIAWQRGGFDDFRLPVTRGLTPQAEATDEQPNWHHYRGPYDAVFGWRHPHRRAVGGGGSGGMSVEEDGDSGWSQGDSGGGPRQYEYDGYTTYGTHAWMLARGRGSDASPIARLRHELRYSRYLSRLRQIADIKLAYAWPGQATTQVIAPEWITSYPEAEALAASDPGQIHHTQYLQLVFVHTVSPGQATQPMALENRERTIRRGGWVPRPPGLTDADRVAQYIWHDQIVYVRGGGNVPEVRTFYDNYFIFIGVNVGELEPVRNPYNFSDRDALPAPIDFDHAAMTPDELTRRELLTFLGIARRDHTAPFWTDRFDRHEMDIHQHALAQVQVFNNHSWDLWTQMWQVQLQPVDDFDGWTWAFEADAPVTAQMPGLNDAAVSEMRQYLHSIDALAPVMLQH